MKLSSYVLIVITALSSLISNAQTQRPHSSKDEIRSLNWGIIGEIRFKVKNENEYYPVYGENELRFADHSFDLEGYIIPIKNNIMQSEFMFAPLPLNECNLDGKNNNSVMIMVKMANPVKFTFSSVKLRGILKLENKNAEITPPVSLIDAKLIN